MQTIQAICPPCKGGVEMSFYLGENKKTVRHCPKCGFKFIINGFGKITNYKNPEYVREFKIGDKYEI
jgi:Zn ribbon nucleic-acid-binding protein